MSRGFVWDKNRFFEVDTVSDVHCFIDKGMVKESVNIVKKRKVAEPSRLVLEIVKSASNAGIDMIMDLVTQITVKGVIPPMWELSTEI